MWLAWSACVLAGCYASDGPRDGSVADADMADGTPPFDGDAGMCDWLGSTRLCGPYCGLRCPEEVYACSSTSNDFHICENAGPDFEPRGQENCLIDLRFGTPYCYSGRLCVTSREPGPDGITWSGGCVSDEYCRWIQSQPGFERVSCRYTDGLVFEDGPPDDECAAGALPADPFCGGRCGDTCPANPYADFFGGPPSCVGRSETRGFGVCVQGSWDSRCWIGQELRAETFAIAARTSRRSATPAATLASA